MLFRCKPSSVDKVLLHSIVFGNTAEREFREPFELGDQTTNILREPCRPRVFVTCSVATTQL